MAGSSSEPLLMAGISTGEESVRESNQPEKMKVMLAVSQADFEQGNPQVSNSNNIAFDWILDNIIGTSYDSYKIFLIHVQVPQSWIRKCIRDCWYKGIWALMLRRADESRDDHRNKVPQFMANIETQCRDKNIEFESLLRMGCPEKVICAEVKNVDPYLLVLGNRGHNAFQRLFRASVSEYCAKYAECPIIRINPTPKIIRSIEAIYH